jgi:uncharacterized membrane protein YdjX (TVP38/TMEM64 family)
MNDVVQHLDSSVPGRPVRPDASTPRRIASLIKWISGGVVLLCIILLVRLLPVENAVRLLSDRIDRLGVWGPFIFGLVYILAAILFVPGSALTLAAGAIFGLFRGTIIVSIASTTAAALAFVIARYFARGSVERRARRYPKFGAIDQAIGKEGWKIIALLRLSPAIPFSVANYLYGLTAIRFLPYVISSWLAMLPGTFMYVYLGYLGRSGLTGNERTLGQWALLIAGLLATILVTVYITILARRAMRNHVPESQQQTKSNGSETLKQSSATRGALIAVGLAIVAVGGVACSYANRSKLSSLFGPPSVTLKDTTPEKPDSPKIDHSAFDELLKTIVSPGGWVDYDALRADSEKLDRYIAALGDVPFDDLGRNEKLALLLNGYNAFTLRLILDHYPVKSIKDISAAQRWDAVRWKIGRHVWSLNQIEHEQTRPNFREPRVHFALVCAAIGCPPLRSEAYSADRIEEQLEDQARYVHDHDRWFRYDETANVARLTKLYQWYGGDFEQVAGSVLKFASSYAPALNSAMAAGREPRIVWIDYNWSLNSKDNRK